VTGRYILIGQTPVPEPDQLAWAAWMGEHAGCRVAEDQIGPYWISTVFLGVDYQLREGPPLLFETMVFWAPGGERKDPLVQRRTSAWLEAEREHAAAVEACRAKAAEEAEGRTARESRGS
jgi:hypothetical protein